MNAKQFMTELQSVIDQFEEQAKEYGTISEEGVEICIVKGYAVLRAEVEDGDETIVCKQEVEFFDDDASPVQPLDFTTE